MNINITPREQKILEDQKKHEEMCIHKYNNYAHQAQDQELKQIFQTYAGQEQKHLDTLSQMLSGQAPDMQQSGQQGQQSQQAQPQAGTGQNPMQDVMANQTDEALCRDQLTTEKYISSTYNTAIFEFSDTNARQVLNHIQKEEQQHGEGIMNYMKKKGIYSS